MVSVMRVDVAPLRHLLGLAAVSIGILLLAIIIGATGPPVYDQKSTFAYDCPQNSHAWDEFSCGGVELAKNTSWWKQDVPLTAPLNRFWSLQFSPFTTLNTQSSPQYNLHVQVELSGTNDWKSNEWYLISNDTTVVATVCPQNPCDATTLVYEEVLRYTYYYIRVRVLNGEGFLGDVGFTFWRAHAGFSKLELSLRIIFLVINMAVASWFLWRMRTVALSEWCWEQRAVGVLLVTAFLQSNPLYGLEYATRGWFLHFLDALFATTFMATFLMFALFSIDKLRNEENRVEFAIHDVPKVAVVGLYAVLGVVMFAWVNIRDRMDPVYGRPDSVTGIEVLFYLESTVYVCILIWLAILIVMTWPVASAKPYIMTRFAFVSVPTAVFLLSILLGIFTGTFGPLRITALSMVYYQTMFSLYVWIMAFGYWPVPERFAHANPREEDSILKYNSFVRTEEE